MSLLWRWKGGKKYIRLDLIFTKGKEWGPQKNVLNFENTKTSEELI